ncbi:MAG TPA: hypothetical protein VMQ76_01595 [Terracidiphilus sp.]|jgi:hypothetical protein|nr:hypothetical protein [Terracidiphilus sp.]
MRNDCAEPLIPTLQSEDVIRQVYERFRPLTKLTGPLFAGKIAVDGKPGKLFLTEAQYWLWMCDCGPEAREMTHSEVGGLTNPQSIVRELLSAVKGLLGYFEDHLDRIEGATSDVPSLLGFYLSNPSALVVDAIATEQLFTLNNPEEWNRMVREGRAAEGMAWNGGASTWRVQ